MFKILKSKEKIVGFFKNVLICKLTSKNILKTVISEIQICIETFTFQGWSPPKVLETYSIRKLRKKFEIFLSNFEGVSHGVAPPPRSRCLCLRPGRKNGRSTFPLLPGHKISDVFNSFCTSFLTTKTSISDIELRVLQYTNKMCRKPPTSRKI